MLLREISGAVAASLMNVDSRRVRAASTHRRDPGFTETWGGEDDPVGDDESPSPPVVLYQHGVAWAEQLALRLADVDHVVVDTAYACCESAGAAPWWIDLGASPPAVGRGRDRWRRRPVADDDDDDESARTRRGRSAAIETLLRERAAPLWWAWRDALATTTTTDDDGGLFAASQRWCVAAAARREHAPRTRRLVEERRRENRETTNGDDDVDVVRALLWETYAALDALAVGRHDPASLSDADASLFGHLCDAFSSLDPDEVRARVPRLRRFWRDVHLAHFGDDRADDRWRANDAVNRANARYYPPALLRRLLDDGVDDDDEERRVVVAPPPRRDPFAALRRLRTGGDLWPDDDDVAYRGRLGNAPPGRPSDTGDDADAGNDWRRRQRESAEENDRVWFAVVAAAATAVLLATSSNNAAR